MEIIKEYNLKSGNILRIIRDKFAQSPASWEDENVFLVYNHRQFDITIEGFDPNDINEYLEGCHEQKENDKYDDYFIFPVDAYIHSEIHLSLSDIVNYPDKRWDVSTTGYILVKRNLDDTAVEILEDHAKNLVERLLETWNQYLSGEVYAFQILKPVKKYIISEENFNDILHLCHKDDIVYSNVFKKLATEKIEFEEIDNYSGFYGNDPKTNGIFDYISEYDEIIYE
jgi:hypothetical protein